MHWVLFLLAAGCFIVVLYATSTVLLFIALLAMLLFMFAGIITLASARIQGQSRNEAHILSPEDLRALRNKAQAGNAVSAGRHPPGTAPAPPAGTVGEPQP